MCGLLGAHWGTIESSMGARTGLFDTFGTFMVEGNKSAISAGPGTVQQATELDETPPVD